MTTLKQAVAVGGTALALGASVFVRAQSQPAAAGPKPSIDYVRDIEPIFEDLLLRVPRAEEGPGAAAPAHAGFDPKGGETGAVVVAGKEPTTACSCAACSASTATTACRSTRIR